MDNREILFTIKMKNMSRAAISQFGLDMILASSQTKELTKSLKEAQAAMQALGRTRKTSAGGGGKGGSGGGSAGGGATVADGFKKAAQEAKKAAQEAEKLGNSAGGDKLAGSLRSARVEAVSLRQVMAALSATFAILAAKRILSLADDATNIQSRLKQVTTSSRELSQTYENLYGVSQKTRQSFETTSSIYSTLYKSTETLALKNADLLRVTEAISKATFIGGGAAESQKMALIQLGQAMGSGTLRGEELNSVMEQTPRLAQAIADGLNVPVASLRKLAEAGKLTSAQVVQALLSQADVLDKEFATAGITAGQAFTVMSNAVVDFVGRIDRATASSRSFYNAIIEATNILRDPATIQAGITAMELFGQVLVGVVKAVVFLIQNINGVIAVLGTLASIRVGAMIGGLVVSLTEAAAAAGGLGAALSAMLGGPIGIAIAAIGTGIALWATSTDGATKALETHKRVVEGVGGTYKEATGQAREFGKVIIATTITEARENLKNLTAQLQKLRDEAQVPIVPKKLDKDGTGTALAEIVQKFKDGKVSGEEFRKEVDRLAQVNPGISKGFVKQLFDLSRQSDDAAQRVKEAEAALAYLNGTATEAQKSMLGLGEAVEETGRRFQAALNNVGVFETALKKLATYAPETNEQAKRLAAVQQATADYQQAVTALGLAYQGGALDAREYAQKMAELDKAFTKAKEGASGFTEALKQLKDTEKAAALTGIYDQRQREIAEIKQRYEELDKTIRDSTASDADKAAALGRSTAAMNKELSNLQGQRDFDFTKSFNEETIQTIRTEAATVGLNTQQRERYTNILNVELQARRAGVSDVQQYVKLYAQEYDALQKVKQAYQDNPLNGLTQGFDKFVQENLSLADKVADAWKGALDGVADNLADLVFDGKADFASMIKDFGKQLFSAGLKNIMAKAFQGFGLDVGKQAGPSVIQSPLATINAGTVNVNGATGFNAAPVGGVTSGPLGPVGGGNSAQMAASVIKNYEGFRKTAYWDVNAYRTGFGSDTQTDAVTGQVSRVTKDFTTTLANANADLNRRINEFQNTIRGQVGSDTFNNLPTNAQAGLTSVAYNYGSLPGSVVGAVKGGDIQQIAAAVRNLDSNPSRRADEANLISGQNMPDNQMVANARQAQQQVQQIQQQGAQLQIQTVQQTQAQLQQIMQTGNQQQITQAQILSQNLAAAERSGDPQKIAAAQQAAQQYAQLTQSVQAAGNAAQTASPALASVGTKAATATPAVGGFGSGIGQLLGPLAQAIPGLGQFGSAIMSLISNLFSAKPGGGGGGLLGGLLIPGILHSGGRVGEAGYGHNRSVTASVFASAQRFHSGGYPGLKPDEVPLIGLKGERMLNRQETKAYEAGMVRGIGNGGSPGQANSAKSAKAGSPVNFGDINVNVSTTGSSGDPAKDNEHAKNMSKQIGEAIEQKMTEFVTNHQRPGGLLYKQG